MNEREGQSGAGQMNECEGLTMSSVKYADMHGTNVH